MMRIALCAAALALTACGPDAAPAPEAVEAPAATPAAAPAPPNAATMKGVEIAQVEAAMDQGAASVNKVIPLERGDAKIFSTVGGDPAINGEYVYLALMGDPAQGSKVFRIGDFNSWDMVEQTKERAVLYVSRSAMDEPTGQIVTYEQKIAVQVPAYTATQVNVTPVP